MQVTIKARIIKVTPTDRKTYIECGDIDTFEKFSLVVDKVPAGFTEGSIVDLKNVEATIKNGKYSVMIIPLMKGGE